MASMGVAMGTALEMMIFKLLIQPVFTCRAIGLSIYRYYVEILLFTALKALVPLLAYFYLVRCYIAVDYRSIALAGIIQALLFATMAYFTLLDIRKTIHEESNRDSCLSEINGLTKNLPLSS